MAVFDLPDFAFANDGQMGESFPSLDGRWSEQTKRIRVALGSDLVDLNGSWADTPTDWRCPVCRRLKPEIARLSPTGVILCQLERHHDHLGDEGNRILWLRQRKPEDRASADALHSAIKVCTPLCERFYPVLVCSDCNAADGAAKALLSDEIEPEFSFAPSEIARFIRVAPNRPHEIVEDLARALWRDAEADVRDRLAFMSVMADRIADGRHIREGSGYTPDHKAILLTDILGAASLDRARVEGLSGVVSARSIQRDGFASSAKPPARKKTAIPTLADLECFTAGVRPGDFWHEPSDGWRCAACDRSRFEMLRKSPKSNLWTAGAHRRRVFVAERRPEASFARSGWSDPGLMFGDHEVVWVCKDCRQVVTDAKHTSQHLTDDCLSVADVRLFVAGTRAHERPEYDRQAAARLARGNFEVMAAIDDYDRHRKRCLDLFYSRRQLLRHETAVVVDAHLVQAVWADYVEPSDRAAHLAWLIEEGQRYAEANARLMRLVERTPSC